MQGVKPLIEGVAFNALLADKAFDADWLLEDLDQRGAAAVIPPKANRKVQRTYDKHAYKWRHLVKITLPRSKNLGALLRATTRQTAHTELLGT